MTATEKTCLFVLFLATLAVGYGIGVGATTWSFMKYDRPTALPAHEPTPVRLNYL